MANSAKPNRRQNGAGFSLPAAADELDVPYKAMREAVALGQVKTIAFGKQERIPRSEIRRLRELFAGEGSSA